MLKHELFALLRTLSPSEIKRIRVFLQSPYFNKNRKAFSLFSEIMKFCPSFSSNDLSKKELFLKVYKNHEYNDSTIRNLLFRLLKLIKVYLAISAFEKENFAIDNYLLRELINRNLRNCFLKEVKKVDKRLTGKVRLDSRYLYNTYLFYNNKFNFGKTYDRILNNNIVCRQMRDLMESNVSLTIFYITEEICDYMNKTMFLLNYDIKNQNENINLVLQNLDIENVYDQLKDKHNYAFLLGIYICLLDCFSNFDNLQKYLNYRNLLAKYLHLLSQDEINFHYTNLINYCILKNRLGDSNFDFNEELFRLYNEVLINEYYKDSKTNYLSYKLFRDILLLALRIKEFDWFKNFIDNYSMKVHPDYQRNMYYLGYAYYYEVTKQFGDSLKYLDKINLEYFIYKFDVKKLKLRIFFELNYLEECLYLIHSFREFLRKDVLLPEERKKATKLFIDFTEKMTFFRMGKPGYDLGYIKQKILVEKNISCKNWLLEKVEKLEDRNAKKH